MTYKVVPIDLTPSIYVVPLAGIYQIEHEMQCAACHRSDYTMSVEYARQMLAFEQIWPCCCGQAMTLLTTARNLQVGAA